MKKQTKLIVADLKPLQEERVRGGAPSVSEIVVTKPTDIPSVG